MSAAYWLLWAVLIAYLEQLDRQREEEAGRGH